MPFDDGKKTVSGSIAHTDDAAAKVPFVSLKCGIAPTLTGKSAIECDVGTNNFFDDKHLNVGLPATSIGSSIDTINTSATRYTYNGFLSPRSNIAIKGSRNDTNVVGACLFFGYKDGLLTDYRSINPFGASVVSIDCSNFDYIRISIGASSGYQAPTDMTSFGYVSAEYGTTFTEYVQADTNVSTVNLGRTIYGGTADVVKGEGESTHANVKVSDLTWIKQTASDRDFFIAQVPTMKSGIPEGQYNDIVSDIPYGGELRVSSMADKSLASWTTSLRIYDTDITTVSELLEAYGNDGISYPLATPENFTFTPITPTPETVGKVNNVYCNTGDTELTYYDNAHGFAEVTVNRCGKNLWDEQWEVGGINDATGVPNSDTDKIRSKTFSIMKGGATYYAKAPNNIRVLFYASDYSFLSETNNIMNATFTAPSNCVYFKIRGTVAYGTTYNNDIAINYPSTETAYEEYSRESKTAYLHKVIYGGQADVVRGICEPKNLLDDSKRVFAAHNIIFGRDSGGRDDFCLKLKAGTYTFSVTTADGTYTNLYLKNSDTKESISGFPAYATFSKSFTLVEDTNCAVFVYKSDYTSVSDITSAQIEKSSTASEYVPHFDPFTFTPISIETDEGENTLFANEGDSSITYRKAVD